MPEIAEPDHRSRRMILNYLREHPGSTRSELSRVLMIAESTLRYHLQRMEKAGNVRTIKDNGHSKYFCSYVEIDDDVLDRSGLTQSQRRLVRLVHSRPGITRAEVLRTAPKGNSSILSDLKHLSRMRIIRRTGQGLSSSYSPVRPDELKREILKAMVSKLISHEIDESTFLRLKEELDRRFP